MVLRQENLADDFLNPLGLNNNVRSSIEPTVLIDNECLQLIFPIKNFFLFGSPLGMFTAVYFEESFIRSKLPTVEEFFNVFHPSDLVANRLEPLVKRFEYPCNRGQLMSS